MASGILGQANPAADTDTAVYTVPTGMVTTANLSICNRDLDNAVTVRVAISSTSTPSDEEYVEYETIVGPTDVLERTGLVMNAGKNLVVRTSAATVSVNAYGFEEEV